MRNRFVLIAAFTAAALGVAGLVALALPAGAGEQPSLPDVSAEDLVSSALAAQPPAMAGTVTVDNALGLPSLPGLPQLGAAESTIRVWADGAGRSRIAMPSGGGEQTLIHDGETLWSWDSVTRTATKFTTPTEHAANAVTDPATLARGLIGAVRASSTVAVDGTAAVADRAAYELVLAPAPTERTLLREIRIAVDAESRIPLRLVVLANGSAEPVFSIGFTELAVEPQDAALFRFIPPAGAKIIEGSPTGSGKPAEPGTPGGKPSDDAWPTVIGDGWDTVIIAEVPGDLLTGSGDADFDGHGADLNPAELLNRIGTPISGPWGNGTLFTTAVATAIITTDGRVAAGAVPQQVLVEALSR